MNVMMSIVLKKRVSECGYTFWLKIVPQCCCFHKSQTHAAMHASQTVPIANSTSKNK